MTEIKSIETLPPQKGDWIGWIKQQADKDLRPYLLAFCEDGVVWGGFVNGVFQTSEGMGNISPRLTSAILHEAHVFGAQEEIRLFKDGAGNWVVKQITDNDKDVIVESQVLWGSRAYEPQNGFTRVFDARQKGLDHFIPLEVANSRIDPDASGSECLRLEVHHLVEYDEQTGEARIALSRLAGLSIGKKDNEVAK